MRLIYKVGIILWDLINPKVKNEPVVQKEKKVSLNSPKSRNEIFRKK